MKKKQRFTLNDWRPRKDSNNFIVTGWLEKNAIIAGKNTLHSLVLDKIDSVNTLKIDGNPVLMETVLVQSDSKTALMTIKDSADLRLFDFRQLTFASLVPTGLSVPNAVMMGQTNTLCH